jgi:hypothetical protein
MTLTSIRLWTQDEYHRMTEAGIIDPDERDRSKKSQDSSLTIP